MIFQRKTFTGKDGKPYLLRSPAPADAEQMIRYLKTSAQETDYGLSYPEELNFTIQDEETFISGYAEDPLSIMIAVFDGQDLVGYAYLSSILDQKKAVHRASFGIALLKRVWRKGLGRQLLSDLIAFAMEAGYEQIELEVVSSNIPAVNLYRKMGFTVYGERPRSLKLKDGSYFNELLMILSLEERDEATP